MKGEPPANLPADIPGQDSLLRQLVLQATDLPPGSDYRNNGPYQLNLPSNPLFDTPDFDPEEVANYYHIFATVPISLANGQPGLLPVMNHAYRYHSTAQAVAQWQATADKLQRQATEVISLSETETKLITVKLTDNDSATDEKNRVFWGVLQHKDVLLILVVDDLTGGVEPTNPVGQRVFTEGIRRLVGKLE